MDTVFFLLLWFAPVNEAHPEAVMFRTGEKCERAADNIKRTDPALVKYACVRWDRPE